MADRTWNEFLFGTEEDKKRAREVLKEMRPDYERPGEKKAEKKAVIDRRAPWTSAEAKRAKTSISARKEAKPPYAGTKAVTAKKPVDKKLAENFKAKMQGRRPLAKAPAKAVTKPSFKGNWTGAAPTEMQKRGGRRIKGPNLMSYLKGK